MKRIVVTGGAGFIGSHLANSLAKQGHDVHVLDDLSGGYKSNLKDNVNFTQIDLREKEKTGNIISEIKPSLIYHLAADATEGRSQFTPAECTERNINTFLNTIVPAVNNGLEKFVFTSSMAVYGAGEQKPPFSEDMEPKPEDVYGISKHTIEQQLKVLGKVHEFNWTIIRPHNYYGPAQNMADPYRNVIAIWMNALLKDKPYYIYGDGDQKRAFSFIDDATPCLVMAGLDDQLNGEIVNVGSPQEYTIKELSDTLLKVSGSNHQPLYLPGRPQEVKDAYCTNDKAESLLGYKHTVDLENGLKKMWDWAKKMGPQEPQYLDNLEITSDKTPETWTKKLY